MKKITIFPLVILVGCGSTGSGTGVGGDGGQDPGQVRADDPRIEKRDVNPQGKAYPSGPYGTGKRGSPTGQVRGDTIENFRFLGYPKSDKAGGLKTVALVDSFNPDGANGNIKLIHIQAAGAWCVYCRNEQDMVTPKMSEIEGKGVVWLTAVVEGTKQGGAAEMVDLDNWLTRHKTVNTVVIDSANKNLGVFFRQAALPWNGWVDARTMEILAYQEGAPQNYDALASDMDGWLKFVDANPVQK
ncbi:MAG: hypothetical protein U0174_26065 [Polyangiaceae bacterium]